jgi:5-methylthioadenosine/S-adenosylhomocysteine deaminase
MKVNFFMLYSIISSQILKEGNWWAKYFEIPSSCFTQVNMLTFGIGGVMQAYYADYIYYNSTAYKDSWLITNNGVIEGIANGAPDGAEEHIFHESAIFPAFINTHTHLPMTLLRGYADDLPLHEWLNNYIWPAESKWLSAEFVRDSTFLAAAELIHSGTACANDMYFFTREMIPVFNEAGLRGVFGCGIMEIPGKSGKGDYLARAAELVQENKDNPLIKISLCPHALYTASPEIYRQSAAFAQKHDIILHTHLAETKKEVHDIQQKYGKTPVMLMESTGAFDCPSIFAHCVHLTDEEIELLGKKQVNVAHCIQSNMKLASGCAPIDKLIKAGANGTIGTDGCASNNDQDMLTELSTVALFHKAFSESPTALTAPEAFKCATANAAKALKLPTGELKEGAPADFMVVSYSAVHMQPVYDHLSHLLYTAGKNDITDLYVAGRPLMQAGKIQSFDEEEVINKAKYWAKKIQGN